MYGTFPVCTRTPHLVDSTPITLRDAPVIGERRGTPQGHNKPAAIISPFFRTRCPYQAPLLFLPHYTGRSNPSEYHDLAACKEADPQCKCRYCPCLEGSMHSVKDLVQPEPSPLLSRTRQHLHHQRDRNTSLPTVAKPRRTRRPVRSSTASTAAAWTSRTTRTRCSAWASPRSPRSYARRYASRLANTATWSPSPSRAQSAYCTQTRVIC